MLYLKLFLTFLEIGAVSFGGGYGMISLIHEKVISYGWLSESEFLSFIAVSESTPGPLAVNMGTFIGSSQGGMGGALAATAGVVLPSFIVIIIIAALINNLLKFAGVRAFLSGVRPCITALIIGTAITMFLSYFIGFDNIGSSISFDWRASVILALLVGLNLLLKLRFHKKLSPIVMILISAALGVILYGI